MCDSREPCDEFASDATPKVLVINGPSLSALGRRQPHIYGSATLEEINNALQALADQLGLTLECLQTNHEGCLIDEVLAAADRGFAGILINAGAYTHTSLAIGDALAAAGLPTVEVHLTNTAAREPVRHRSYIARACLGTIAGFGKDSYLLGLRGLAAAIAERRSRLPGDHT